MDRRASWRIPVRVNLKYYLSNKEYSGTMTNLSENGMFIITKAASFPEYAQFNVLVPLKQQTLHLSVKHVRTVKINGSCGIGAEVIGPSDNYIEYVEDLLQVLYI